MKEASKGASREYATALFELAAETGSLEDCMKALEEMVSTAEASEGFIDLLSAPGIPVEERTAIVEKCFGGLSEYALSMLCILIERGRASYLKDVAGEFAYLYNEHFRVITAKVTSAVELTEDERRGLTQALEKKSGHRIIIEESIDPSILGGIIAEMDGVVIDGSLKTRLSAIKEVITA